MYQSFYGLTDKPFSMLPDPAFLYLGKKHQTALTLLEYGLYNKAGFCVISGDTGAGKTTLLRQLLNSVDDSVVVGMITNTHQSFGTLLDWVLSAFNIHQPNMDKVEMHQLFVDFLLEQYSKNKTTLLVVDEAQNLPAETLEELRMLSNLNSEKDQVLQVILAGQPELKNTLRQPELMQFAQRIAVDYHLEHLGVEETCGYIQHRLKTSGATKDIFTPGACIRVHSYSGGTPRLINLICDTVLVYGFADQKLIIDEHLIDEMVRERMKDSVVPILNVDSIEEIQSREVKELDFEFPSLAVTDEVVETEDLIDDDVASVTDEVVEAEEVIQEEKSEAASEADQIIIEPEVEQPEPLSHLEEKMHNLENEIHGLEENVHYLEHEVHDKDLLLFQGEATQVNAPLPLKIKYLIAAFIIAILLLLAMVIDKTTVKEPVVVIDPQSVELKKMLTEVENTKKELEVLKSKEADRLVEMARIKAEEIQRKSDLALQQAKAEEEKVKQEKIRAVQELRVAREKALRAEKKIDDMLKQRKLEEKKRHEALLLRERELEDKREALRRAQALEDKKRAEIQKKFDEIENKMVVVDEVEKKIVSAPKPVAPAPKKNKSFVTDPCSSSSARFLSTCR